jgi:hypothetical protein
VKDQLATTLLVRVMGWNDEEATRERIRWQWISNLKYDGYHQFAPGMRFIESLARWLSQFDTVAERRRIYEYLLPKLVFVSIQEMEHIVGTAFNDWIRFRMLERAARDLKEPEHRVLHLENSPRYRLIRRRSLFLGLSDGAHVDWLRRDSELGHHQIWMTYEVSKERATELQEELASSMTKILNKPCSPEQAVFESLYLLDDFTASGKSFMRFDSAKNKASGKVRKVLDRLTDTEHPLHRIVSKDVEVNVLFYVATTKAIVYLEDELKGWAKTYRPDLRFSVNAIHRLDDNLSISELPEDIEAILRKYFDPNIVDKHYKVGKHDRPYLGFDECGLPVILFHNSPNNSIPLLWFEEGRTARGLFPRVSRHGGAD